MLAKVQSCAVIGLEGALVEVEVDLANGLAAFTIVGLPDAAINESRERVRSAIENCGCIFPYRKPSAKAPVLHPGDEAPFLV
jgi:magnesium chelatase family protein